MSIRSAHPASDPVRSYPLGWGKNFYALAALTILLPVVVIFSCTLGSIHIPFLTCLQVLLSRLPFVDITPSPLKIFGMSLGAEDIDKIILNIRLPRILLAGLAGMGLSVAGATFQRLFRNPLADPYLLGVASGAGLGATVGLLIPFGIGLMDFGVVPLFAFVGGLGAVALVYLVAHTNRTLSTTTLILAGVPISSFLSSITSYLMISRGDDLHKVFFWLLGGLSSTTWAEVGVVFPCVVIGVSVIQLYARPLNVMQLDEDQAQQLGINVERVKIILIVTATFITAAAICFAGIIGFVGIIIPHAVRRIWGADYRFLIPLSALIGAVFLILADTLARTLLAPDEVPIGVVTAFCGVPFFLFILRKGKGMAL